MIREAFNQAKQGFGVPLTSDWSQPYYQFCNRLAVLHFLIRNGIGARLLFIYFHGDTNPKAVCPQTSVEWEPAIQAMQQHVGLIGPYPLDNRVHKLFLPVIV